MEHVFLIFIYVLYSNVLPAFMKYPQNPEEGVVAQGDVVRKSCKLPDIGVRN